MYLLLNRNGLRPVLEREFLPFTVALIIAELFFKWGSFAFELVGFLVIWFVFGHISEKVLNALRR